MSNILTWKHINMVTDIFPEFPFRETTYLEFMNWLWANLGYQLYISPSETDKSLLYIRIVKDGEILCRKAVPPTMTLSEISEDLVSYLLNNNLLYK